MPHLSTKIESFGSDTLDNDSSFRRVIVGFNVFLHDIGPIVQNAPEHSHVFNEKVKLQRMQRRRRPQQQQNGGGRGGGRLSLQAVQSNPKLAKLLVLAKRHKVKQDLCQAQTALTQQIVTLLLVKQAEEQQQQDISAGITVADLIQQSCRETNNNNNSNNSSASSSLLSFPTPVDVQVHIHHLCRQGVLQVVPTTFDHDNNKNDSSSSSSPSPSSDDSRSTTSRLNKNRSELISLSQRVRLPCWRTASSSKGYTTTKHPS